MDRGDLLKSILAAPAITAASAQDFSNRVKGLPPLTIKDVKVITTNGGRNYRWVFLKVITSEPGLYGIGLGIVCWRRISRWRAMRLGSTRMWGSITSRDSGVRRSRWI